MEINPKKPSSFLGRDEKEWSTKGIKAYVMLMIEFLRISPSYALAHRIATEKLNQKAQEKLIVKLYEDEHGELTTKQKDHVLKNFEAVIKTYAIYGDISKLRFNEWWIKTGIDLYGAEHAKPHVKQLGRIEKGEKLPQKFYGEFEAYLNDQRLTEGEPATLFIALPLGMNKKYLLNEVSRLIDASKVSIPVKSHKAKIPLAAKRLRSAPLIKGISLIWAKAYYPKWSLWQLGIKYEISPTYAKGMDMNKRSFKDVEQRNVLNILTHRMLTKAKLIAENAARGSYPNSTSLLLPHFDYEAIYKRVSTVRNKR